MERDFDFQFNSEWTLFIDRDGVFNTRLVDDYVKNINELEINHHFLKIYSFLRPRFRRVFIVTNQRGISLGLMTENDLLLIHNHLLKILERSGGIPDEIYHCPHDRNSCDCRKPKPGMAHKAKADYPEIDFARSVMIGDSESDMQFGKNLGMVSVMYPDNLSGMGDLSIDQLLHLLESSG